MAQVKPIWEENTEFAQMCRRIVAAYQDDFAGIDTSTIIAYNCTNKDRPKGKAKPYELSGASEPESFTNSKTYFVKMYQQDWEEKTAEQRLLLAYSVLSRLDPESPGKVGPLDYRDQNRMVRTFGVDWLYKDNLPNILDEQIDFRD